MDIIQACIRNPVKVAVGVLLVALFGVIGFMRMPMQLTPEVQIPTITVTTRWPGASPQEIEREIVQEQEEQLKSVQGVTKMSSESMDSQGVVTLEFAVGTDMESVLVMVNSRLSQVPEYPEDADQPVIATSGANDNAIAWFILSPRMTTVEEVEQFEEANPDLLADEHIATELQRARGAHSPGLRVLRLRRLVRELEETDPDTALRLSVLLPPNFDMDIYRKFAEDVIEARFERVDGVSNSNVFGGREPELQVVIDLDLLAHRGLTMGDVRRALQAENHDTSGGDFEEGKRRYVVRTLSQFSSPEEVAETVLRSDEGGTVYVRDVAEVRHGFKKPDAFVRRFGASSIAVNCVRETGANVLDIMQQLREATAELNEGVLARENLELTQVYDETEYIDSSVQLVNQNIILGGSLTIVVLMVFLHLGVRTMITAPVIMVTALAAIFLSPLLFGLTIILIVAVGFWYARGALVIGLAIPTSIVGTFLLLNLAGRSLNVISLAGLAFAVGMLVDNAVVVLENIYRHWQEGDKPFDAAAKGTKEVWGAVIASTLTTLAVFVPVIFVQEEAGQLFRDIALAISFAVGLSLLVSVTVIPVAAARVLKDDKKARQGDRAHSASKADNLFVSGVVGLNAWVQRGLIRRLVVVLLLVGLSAGLSYLFWPKVEYLPNGNRNLVIGLIFPPPGYNIEKLENMGRVVETRLKPHWDVDPGTPEAESEEVDNLIIEDFFYVARGRSVFLGIRSHDPLRAGDLVPLIDEVRGELPGAFTVARQTSLFGRGLTAGRTVDIEITGPDLEQLVVYGREIFGAVNQEFGPPQGWDAATMGEWPRAQVQPIPSLDLSSPEMHVLPRSKQAAEMGYSADELGYTVDALVDGAYATDYFEGGDKIDLTILASSDYVERTQDIPDLPVATPSGQLVPLVSIAEIKLSSGPEQINRREKQRAITIQVTPHETMALEDAVERIENNILAPLEAEGKLAAGYSINLGGTADKLRDTWSALSLNIVLALLITYLLMAALFESWLYPFVIILSVPLGAVGGILGLQMLNLYLGALSKTPQTLDVLTMLGFVILIGTVVNNAILIVHQALNHMREDNMTPRDSILESVRTRIRPIFMTTTTTVFGLLPLVLFPGAGSELYRGLGAVVLGGLLISTIFTLLLVPAIFSLMMGAKSTLAKLFGIQTLELAAAEGASVEPVEATPSVSQPQQRVAEQPAAPVAPAHQPPTPEVPDLHELVPHAPTGEETPLADLADSDEIEIATIEDDKAEEATPREGPAAPPGESSAGNGDGDDHSLPRGRWLHK